MKKAVILLFAGACLANTAAFAATTDDRKWINRCLADNKGDAADGVVLDIAPA